MVVCICIYSGYFLLSYSYYTEHQQIFFTLNKGHCSTTSQLLVAHLCFPMTPLQSSSLMENDTKRTGWHMSKNSFPQHHTTAGRIPQEGSWLYVSQGNISHWWDRKSSSPHLMLFLLSQLNLGKLRDKKPPCSQPTATPSATNLSLREFASTFLRAGLEHLEPCQMPSAVSVATDAQQTGPWAGSHLQW